MKRAIKNNLMLFNVVLKNAPLYCIIAIIMSITQGVMYNYIGNYLFIGYLGSQAEKLIENPSNAILIFSNTLLVTIIYYLFLQISNTFTEGIVKGIWYQKTVVKIRYKMQNEIMKKAGSVSLSSYDDNAFYNDMQYSINQGENLVWRAFRTVSDCFVCLIVFILFITTFAIVDFRVLLFIIISVFFQFVLNKKNLKIDNDIYNETVKPKKHLEYVNRVFFLKDFAKDIRLNKISDVMLQRFDESQSKIKDVYSHNEKKKLTVTIANNFIQQIVGNYGILLLLSFMYIVENKISLGTFLGLWNGVSPFKARISGVINCIESFYDISLYADRYQKFVSSNSEIDDADTDDPIINDSVSIEFKNVSFKYPGSDDYALKNISFKIAPNETVAIVGYNGAGKSTLYKLLLGLYVPQEGDIYINGVSLRDYPMEPYRKTVYSTLMQQFNLYATSVAQNVTLRNMGMIDNAEVTKIKDALENSGMLSKVESLSNGIYSQITAEFDPEGFCPSGGQKQRIALSRVYYDNRQNILLDEFSSALDSLAEYQMTKQILELSKNKTIIIISHRLTMTKQADNILVFDSGQIVEYGTHAQLIEKNGLYATLYNIQKEKYE